ncbi:MAG: Re/Si-specific NAD(P)(+) transhydrogenase subunit alpha [Intrasporangium sp.]|uniref:Re/Si-specific NAD(P)(+) transhydrogenase subunit alpha n=1 Tax=Intrasporangium sp. TaxID=1925024 RepID=UPI0026490F1B|nr:Re/Si-specific NAD(P)(+) transhydrogenase subunit alpha [Intrasporangium sp.]MDN5798064.1 Re/Si-specific NAD(P)(+) transhydrogenase subunit alpha [Intrasporangium sp.]
MQIGVPRETHPHETRVAATPKTVGQLVGLGYDVVIESGAGQAASFDDAAYVAAGARVVDRDTAWSSEIVHAINPPADDEIALLRPGTVLVGLMAPALDPELVEKLRAASVTAMAMDAVPRISRAQSLDVLSSMANIAGYRAVVEAAHEFGSFFTGQVTAAGKVPPAKVLVVGAGVAGLAAIGTARSLGAIVRATDARPEVAEQVESMGAEFLAVEMPEAEAGPSATGYAKEMGEEYNQRAAEMYAAQVPEIDIIVTTALIPGKPAPRLITGEMVRSMKAGSVIVDMAAATGGNVEGAVADELTVTDSGVKIIGYTDLAARLPTQASQLYGTNLVNLMKLLTPGKDGQLVLDFDDPVQRNMTVARDGELLWPPPPLPVSATPAPAAPAAHKEVAKAEPAGPRSLTRRHTGMAIAALVFIVITALSKGTFLAPFTVFALAVVIGFYVIGNVAHSLHTPLMSVTNAISGIIIVGALLQLGTSGTSSVAAVAVIGFVATLVASINIFGGFTVTQRMLTMFRKG